jgi:ribosomal protein S18 acetylase RimI-like enzyme
VHQAKWLVLGLLKTTASALATTAGGARGASKSSSSSALFSSWSTTTILQPNQPLVPPSSLAQHQYLQPPPPPPLHRTKKPPTPVPPSPAEQQQILLRLARPCDVRGISSVNLMTLPENYNDAFYLNHMTEWPDLALVAVLLEQPSKSHQQPQQQPLHSNYEPMGVVVSPQQQQHGFVRNFQSRFSFLPYSKPLPPPPLPPPRHLSSSSSSSSSSLVVGYLLGKTCAQQPQYMHHSLDQGSSGQQQSYDYSHPLMVGHVSSLAVLPEFRRRGLADALLEQFHAHLVHPHQQHRSPALDSSVGRSMVPLRRTPVSATGLHVRRSNVAAVRLYKKWGYTPAVCIPAYYEDGEDAYYMSKHLSAAVRQRSLELPRLLQPLHNESEENQQQQQALPQLRSGSL